jgi:hypothetical protein
MRQAKINRRIQFVLGQAARMQQEIEEWCRTRDKKERVFIQYKTMDKVRLLKLQTWAMVNKITVLEVLDVLIPIFRAVIKTKRESSGLGVGIRTLTSQRAREILEDALKKRYPEREHIAVWKEKERELQIQREKMEETEGVEIRQREMFLSPLEAPTLDVFVRAYRERIGKKRAQNESELRSKFRKRKRYRGNPWL